MYNFDTSEVVCIHCGNIYVQNSNFIDLPPFLTIDINHETIIDIQKLPKDLKVNNHYYKLLCATFKATRLHFKAIFLLDNEFYLVDDLNSDILTKNIPRHSIDVCFYYLI